MIDQLCKIDGAEQTRAVRRQGLFTARIGGVNGLAIGEVVCPVDAVDENHAGFGDVIGRAHHAVPERARGEGLVDLAAENEVPRAVIFHCRHEVVRDQHREVEIAQPFGRALGLDEVLDVGMGTLERPHHRAASRAGRHDGAAH